MLNRAVKSCVRKAKKKVCKRLKNNLKNEGKYTMYENQVQIEGIKAKSRKLQQVFSYTFMSEKGSKYIRYKTQEVRDYNMYFQVHLCMKSTK